MRAAYRRLLLVLLTLPLSSAFAATESTVEAPGPQGPLAGTFLDVGAHKPVVLLISGSGATDRNGDTVTALKPGTLRLLAEGLAARGVSSVRIDKRGMFGSAHAIPDANQITIHDYVTDVQNWITVIQRRTGAPCIWIAGHSEGATVALASASSVRPLCGLILISSPGRPFGELLRSQLHAAPGVQTLLPQVDRAIDAFETGKTVDPQTLHPGLRHIFHPSVQSYLIDIMRYDPAKLAAAYQGPILLVQGGRDIQVSLEEDFGRLKAAAPKADVLFLPEASHVMKDVPGTERADALRAYTDSAIPLDAKFVPRVAEFVLSH